VEDWAEIRRLHKAEGLSIKEVSRLTVRHVTQREPPCAQAHRRRTRDKAPARAWTPSRPTSASC